MCSSDLCWRHWKSAASFISTAPNRNGMSARRVFPSARRSPAAATSRRRRCLICASCATKLVKPIVASLAGDVEVEEAAEYLYQNGIPSYAYSTELPVEVLGAKYKWARGAGLL